MEELYVALLFDETNKDISDRNLANLLEIAGYNVSLYDTNNFLEFLTEDNVGLLEKNVLDKWKDSMEDGISETWNDEILENYELKFHTNRDVIKITLAFLLHHSADREINEKTLTRTFETAGLAGRWVNNINLNNLIREYHTGEFGNYLKKLHKEMVAGLSQSNVDINKIRVINKELSKIETQEDETQEDQVGINTKTVRKYRPSGTESTHNNEIGHSESSKDSSYTENEPPHSQEKIQSIRSKLPQVDSLITDAEFGQARQLLDDIERQIKELNEKNSEGKRGTPDDELQQLKQKCTNRLSRPRVLNQLREIDTDEFEKLVAKIWEKKGWNAEVTSSSGDRGVDVEATKKDTFEKRRHLIQVKRHGKNTVVGSEDIQLYASLYQRDEQVDNVFVVTSNRFTSEAKEIAKKRDVSTIDGDELYELLTET